MSHGFALTTKPALLVGWELRIIVTASLDLHLRPGDVADFVSGYQDDVFADGKPEAAKALIKRASTWEKESAAKCW